MVSMHNAATERVTGSVRPGTTLDTPPASGSRRINRPPGLVFYLVTVGAILLALDANSRDSFWLFLLAAPIWLLLGATWLLRFGLAIRGNRGRMRAAHWSRWLAIPLALGLVFGLTRTDAVKQGRFDLSRGGLDQMARDVMAGGSLDRGWVGFYAVGTAERTANGFWFVIDDSGLGRWGLAYAPAGVPKEAENNFNPLWTGASFEHLDGPWWTFTQSWD
jgi:hypothetical protein